MISNKKGDYCWSQCHHVKRHLAEALDVLRVIRYLGAQIFVDYCSVCQCSVHGIYQEGISRCPNCWGLCHQREDIRPLLDAIARIEEIEL